MFESGVKGKKVTSNSNSYKQFQREVKEKRGILHKLSAHDFSALLSKNEETFLVYLNSCYSAYTGSSSRLTYYFSLGFFDALAKAGITIIIGQRLPMKDRLNIDFAAEFYRHLFKNYSPEISLLRARKSLPEEDAIWASPVMVKQGSNY